MSHLRQLFEALRKAKLELHPGKCAFGAQEVKYLGHLVTRDGIRACPSKVKAIVEMPWPTCAKEMQRFVGKCQYYRKFIPNFSQVAAPVFKAQSACRDFVWTDACDLTGTRLREALISDAILVHPDYTRDYLLDCDGSGEGLGAVLLQAHDGGAKVVAYASRSLLEHDKKWIATELRAAALIWALETFRPYIDGVHVTNRTGHAPLEYIRAQTDRCKRMERWPLRLQEFRFIIQPRPGAQQKHVDALLRATVLPEPMGWRGEKGVAASISRAWLCSASPRGRRPSAGDSTGVAQLHHVLHRPSRSILHRARKSMTTGARCCSPTERKATMPTLLSWCQGKRRTSPC